MNSEKSQGDAEGTHRQRASGRRLKIVLVTGVPTAPITEGMRHRTAGVAYALSQLGDVSVRVVPTQRLEESELIEARKNYPDTVAYLADSGPSRGLISRVRRRFDHRWIAGRAPQIRAEHRTQLAETCANADLVWVHTLHVADRVGWFDWGAAVLDYDDLVSEKQQLFAAISTTLKDRTRCRNSSRLWRLWEDQATQRFAARTVCSEADLEVLKDRRSVFVVPNAISHETPVRAYEVAGEAVHLGFIGLVKYQPNYLGLVWFIKHVWPKVLEAVPQARLRVIGSLPNDASGLVAPGVDLLGFVDVVDREMSTWRASVVPLQVGGGTRLKIIESLQKGVPVISTPVGAHGLHLSSGQDCLIADEPSAYAAGCVRLLREPELCARLVRAGQEVVRKQYLWPAMCRGVSAAARAALGASGKADLLQESAEVYP